MKLKRDKVISIVRGIDLVGVYDAKTNGKLFFAECSPQVADELIKIMRKVSVKKLIK